MKTNPQITAIVEQILLERMRAKVSFTALDISNALKQECYPVQHREVAALVREVYLSGAMAHYDYSRDVIDVLTDGGAKPAKAFLYRPYENKEREYQTRALTALPAVDPEKARDFAEVAGASPLPRSPRLATTRRRSPATPRTGMRRDRALAIPRSIIQQLGWKNGDQLYLQAENGRLFVTSFAEEPMGTVRVWSSQRVRICQRKLQLGALSADTVTLEIDGEGLKIMQKAGH